MHVAVRSFITRHPLQGRGAAARLQQAAAPGAAELAALEASSSSDDDSLEASDSDADSEDHMRYRAVLDCS